MTHVKDHTKLGSFLDRCKIKALDWHLDYVEKKHIEDIHVT